MHRACTILFFLFFYSEIPATTLQSTQWSQLKILYDDFMYYDRSYVPKIVTIIVYID